MQPAHDDELLVRLERQRLLRRVLPALRALEARLAAQDGTAAASLALVGDIERELRSF
jgi:hypothetical protein